MPNPKIGEHTCRVPALYMQYQRAFRAKIVAESTAMFHPTHRMDAHALSDFLVGYDMRYSKFRKRKQHRCTVNDFLYLCPAGQVQQGTSQACEIAQFDQDKRLKYEKNMMTERDYQHDLYYSRKEGIEEGALQATMTVAKNMKADGVPAATICKYTGLTEEQVNAL